MPSPVSAASPSHPQKLIPYPLNPFFTGRSKILHELHEALTEWRLVVLNGPPRAGDSAGIGKTETAVTYAHRHRDQYRTLLWLRAEGPCTVVEDCLRALAAVGVPLESGRPWEEALPTLREWLRAHDDWLLVLDNVTRADLVKPLLPEPVTGHVLAIARRSASSVLGVSRAVTLPGLPHEEALRFLFKRTGRVDNDPAERRAATELVTLLEGLPQALELAASYVTALDLPFRSYLTTLRGRVSSQTGTGEPRTTDAPAQGPVLLCWEALAQRAPAAAACLELATLLGRERLSLDLLRELGDGLGAVLGPLVAEAGGDAQAGRALLDPPAQFGLIRRAQDPMSMALHPLVHRLVTPLITRETAMRWATRLSRTVQRVCLTDEDAGPQDPLRVLPWLDVAATLGRTGWMRSTEDARLLERLATRFLRTSGFAVAEPLLVAALDAYKTDEAEHRAVSALAHDLGRHYVTVGKRAKADQHFTLSLAARERALGPLHGEVADYLHDLGRRYDEQGRHLQADEYFGRSLAIREHNAGKRHPDVAAYLHLLGCRHSDLGRWEEADACFRRALLITEEAHGLMHPAVAASVHDLACRLGEQQRFGEAAPLFERAVAVARATLPPGHPDLGAYLHSLGRFHHSTGKLRQAEEIYRQALVHTEQMAPAQVAAILNDLGGLYHARRRYAKAEPLLTQALAMARRALAADHPNLSIALNNLAAVHVARRRYAEAEPLLRRALALREKHLPPDHPDLLTMLDNLVAVLRKLKRGEEAESLASRAEGIRASTGAVEEGGVAAAS